MKLACFFIVFLFTGAVISSNAKAGMPEPLYYVSLNNGHLISADTPTGTAVQRPYYSLFFTPFNYSVSGSLANNTALTLTMQATHAWTYDGLHSLTYEGTSAGVKVFAPSFDRYNMTTMIMFTNTSGSNANIKALFRALISANSAGEYSITYAASSVPLPPAALLFASGLLTLVGIRKRRSVDV